MRAIQHFRTSAFSQLLPPLPSFLLSPLTLCPSVPLSDPISPRRSVSASDTAYLAACRASACLPTCLPSPFRACVRALRSLFLYQRLLSPPCNHFRELKLILAHCSCQPYLVASSWISVSRFSSSMLPSLAVLPLTFTSFVHT